MEKQDKRTDKQKVGDLGEDVACMFLKKHNFEILDRNFREKWGEIDIIAKKENILYFVEVKSVTRATQPKSDLNKSDRPTHFHDENGFRPEDNVHPWKQKRLGRTIQTYLLRKKIPDETEWQFDVIVVYLDFSTRKAQIRRIENIIL